MAVAEDWNERAVPLLEAVYASEEAGAGMYTTDDAAKDAGLDQDIALRTMRALAEATPPYVVGSVKALSAPGFLLGARLTERGRRAIGQWPPGAGEAFVAALDRLISIETDPVKRSKLAGLRDSVRGVARDVGVEVVAGAIVAAGTALG